MLKIAISPHVKRLIGRLRDEGCRNTSDIIAQQKHQLVTPKWRLGNCVLVRFIGGHCPLHCPFCVSPASLRNIRLSGVTALTDHGVVGSDTNLPEDSGFSKDERDVALLVSAPDMTLENRRH